MPHSKEEILNSLKMIMEPGQVTELRALQASTKRYPRPHTVSGYYDSVEALADTAMKITNAKGIYFVLNPVNPALLARSPNQAKAVGRADPTTSDRDVLKRNWLPIDIDPHRPAGISASQDEFNTAMKRGAEIRDFLSDKFNWPVPLYGMSGNGCHLLYPIDLPVDDSGLIKSVLAALAFKFNDNIIGVDQTVFNPARIWKLYGTVAKKGADTEERPHRVSKLIVGSSDTRLTTVAVEALKEIADTVPKGENSKSKVLYGEFNLGDWIDDHKLDIVGPTDWDKGRRWVFNTCPWNSDHTDRSAYIIQFNSGAIVAKCLHGSCADKGWKDLRQLIDPDFKMPIERVTNGHHDHEAEPVFMIQNISDLMEEDIPPIRWAIEGLMPEGLTILAGRPKQGKSWMALNMALSLAKGGTALGKYKVAHAPVLYMALEDTKRRMKDRLISLNSVEPLANRSFPNTLTVGYAISPMNEGGLDLLNGWVAQNPEAKLVIIDTLEKFNPRNSNSQNSNTYSEDYQVMGQLQKFAMEHRVAVLVIHHTKKTRGDTFLDDVSGSTGITAGADSVFVLRRELYGFLLCITGKDIEEQELGIEFDKRTGLWNVSGTGGQLRVSAQQRMILDYLSQSGASKSRAIAEGTGIPYGSVRTALNRMAGGNLVRYDEKEKIYTIDGVEETFDEKSEPY